jgi:four helix bundle protein
MTSSNIRSYRELRVYQAAFTAAMRSFELTKGFPVEERFSLVDQIRRSSRAVCANLAEAWRKRRYEAHFVSKLTDSESEAEETRVWLEFATRCGYLEACLALELDNVYDQILAQLVKMHSSPHGGRCAQRASPFVPVHRLQVPPSPCPRVPMSNPDKGPSRLQEGLASIPGFR